MKPTHVLTIRRDCHELQRVESRAKPSPTVRDTRSMKTVKNMAYIQIREITASEVVPLTFRLRFEVWSDETQLTARVRAQRILSDQHDLHARHWAAFDGDEMVAAARMCIHSLREETPDAQVFQEMPIPVPVATNNYLVVKRAFQRRGIARQLDIFRIHAAREGNAACVVLTTLDRRIGQLEQLGFKLTKFRYTPSFAESIVASGMVLTL
jgi:GNAT superfamily N-acetyltransferase